MIDLDLVREALDEPNDSPSRWVRPLSDTSTGLVEQLASTDNRFRLGIAAIDLLTRGTRSIAYEQIFR
jgi:hypothetical protein